MTIFVILLNCVLLILEVNDIYEQILIIFYLCEMLLKIFAVGFIFKKKSYLRSNWNKFDFLIINLSIISYFFKSQVNFSAIRIFRILRPLRTISSIKNLRVLLGLILLI